MRNSFSLKMPKMACENTSHKLGEIFAIFAISLSKIRIYFIKKKCKFISESQAN